jgi:hypothetical protein
MAEQQKTTPPAAKPAAGTDTTEDRLRAENAELRRQLAAVGGRVQQPQHVFQLSEGDRQELEIRGVVNIGGRLMTTAEVREALADAGEDGVKVADAPEGTRVDPALLPDVTGPGVRGIDYVYPSVERGFIDPAVAGTPGINGPSADDKPKIQK